VVSDEGGGVLEIKNIAVELSCRRRGYGRALIEYLTEVYAGKFAWLQVGTGESPLTLPFYESCGFKYSHRAKDFFTKNYKRPIYEGGVLLKDMVFLRRRL
jgi:GNAT superfamily N-acetyltransferase